MSFLLLSQAFLEAEEFFGRKTGFTFYTMHSSLMQVEPIGSVQFSGVGEAPAQGFTHKTHVHIKK